MFRIILLAAFYISSATVFAQDNLLYSKLKDSIILNTRFQKNEIYFFCRGTYSKAGMIAKYFNLGDTVSTHVGIGFMKSDKLSIYHVTTGSQTNNAFKIETLREFLDPDDVYSFQIWKIILQNDEIKKVCDYCSMFSHRVVSFDYKFDISNDDTLYCSEFCANLLHSVNEVKFNFLPVSKDISNTFFAVVLHKNKLVYYPVDFFQSSPYFINLASYVFKK